jgi:hypothetical protein
MLAAMSLSTAALADDAGIMRCRAIGDSAARLACYDALARQIESRFGAPPAAAAPKSQAPAAAAPKSQAPAAAAPATAPQAAAPGTAPPQTAANFGLENRPVEGQLQSIQSTIRGRFEGWGPNQRIRLANGQVWQIADNTSAYVSVENPSVAIRRGMLGAFYLEIEKSNRSPRVKRVE